MKKRIENLIHLFRTHREIWWIIIYTAIYLGGFQVMEHARHVHYHLIHTWLDDQIPFCPYFIIPYGVWFIFNLYVVGWFVLKAEKYEYYRLITALKTVLPALEWICENQNDVDGFICPGHVSVITGIHVYDELAAKYGKPFVVAGFEAEHILATVYRIVRQIETGESQSENLYRNAVRDDGNAKALAVIDEVFETGPAVWRGLGEIAGSGLYLRGEYAAYDGGSRGLSEDMELPAACRCGDVIVGRIDPDECPMFGKGCDPIAPYGPCMVSAEGSCGIWFRNKH